MTRIPFEMDQEDVDRDLEALFGSRGHPGGHEWAHAAAEITSLRADLDDETGASVVLRRDVRSLARAVGIVADLLAQVGPQHRAIAEVRSLLDSVLASPQVRPGIAGSEVPAVEGPDTWGNSEPPAVEPDMTGVGGGLLAAIDDYMLGNDTGWREAVVAVVDSEFGLDNYPKHLHPGAFAVDAEPLPSVGGEDYQIDASQEGEEW